MPPVKRGAKTPAGPPAEPPKKTINKFKIPRSNSLPLSSPKKASQPLKLKLVAAIFQKGEKTGQRTGNWYLRGIGAFGTNDAFKVAAVKYFLKDQSWKWGGDSSKEYACKVLNKVQAQKIYTATVAVMGPGSEKLPKIPEGLDEWLDENQPQVSIYPHVVDGIEVWCVTGDTYNIWPQMAEKFPGFTYTKSIGGNDQLKGGVIQKTMLEFDQFLYWLDEIGWRIEVFDEVEEDEGDEQ